MSVAMDFEFAVAIRKYGDLAIAETVGPYHAAAAGESEAEALAALEAVLESKLARTHPAELPTTPVPTAERVETRELPLYFERSSRIDIKAKSSAEAETAGEPRVLSTAVQTIVESYGGTLRRVLLPGLNVSRWRLAPDENQCTEEGGKTEEDVPASFYDELAGDLRRRDARVSLHRHLADAIRIEDLSVAFEPPDVSEFGELPGMLGPLAGNLLPTSSETESSPLLEIGSCWSDPEGPEDRGIEPIFGRRDELEELGELLSSARPEAVVLVGPARVGKSSLVRHLAWSTARSRSDEGSEHDRHADPVAGSYSSEGLSEEEAGGRAPEIWFADAARLTSLDSPYGGWRDQSRKILEEIEQRDAILYLGRLIETLDAGKSIESQYNLAQFLKPVLDQRRVRVVAEATPPEWTEIEQRTPGFARNFQVVRLEEPPEAEARDILEQAASRMAQARGIEIAEGAVGRVWRFQNRFTTEGSPLGRAIDFVDRTLRRIAQEYGERLEVVDVVEHFCEETGLPLDLLRDDRTLDLEDVRRTLEERVMGQSAAIERAADVIGVTKADLGARDRPLGVFFFVGPTGVGKTELAKALAAFMFGDESRMIRLDMSEYSTPGAYNRLIGEGPVDRRQSKGDLTGPVRRHPFSVVLLDEIEKAHGGVFDMLLQVFGEARLTDASGRTTRFQNTIIVMTSNLGVEGHGGEVGFDAGTSLESWERHFRRAAEDYFRPEFLGRVDQFVPFRPLPKEIVVQIADRDLSRLGERIGLRRRNAEVEIDDRVVEWVAEEGWNERYGARPIERVIEQSVAWRLADALADDDSPASEPVVAHISLDSSSDREHPIAVAIEPARTHDRGHDRTELDRLVERTAEVRRDLQKYVDSELFDSLVQRVDRYDESSRDESFWDEAEAAAEQARRAERAREIVEPARSLVEEVFALEDLAREAYHDRSTETKDEIAEQIDQYERDVEDLFYTLLTATYSDPNEIAICLVSEHPEDEWRDRLVELYQRLAEDHDWHLQLWQAIPPGERERPIGMEDEFDREDVWRTQRAPRGTIVLLEFTGRAVRPFLAYESGRHRRVTEDETEVVLAETLPSNDEWPHPERLRRTASKTHTARTWNFEEMTVRAGDGRTVAFDPRDPWMHVAPLLKHRAWEAASWN